MRDAMFAGRLYDTDVPKSEGQIYPAKKKAVLDLVPAGGIGEIYPMRFNENI